MNILKRDGEYKKYLIIEHYTYNENNKEHYVIKISEILDNGQEKIHKLTSIDKENYTKAIKKGYLELRLPIYIFEELDR